MKRAIVERALASILEDLERLPQADREQYIENRKIVMNQILHHDIDQIDFKKFDID
jgi:hypothetical protein